MLDLFSQVDTWIALLTLTFLEVVLGIDNIIFISIAAGKLPDHQIKRTTRIGLILALVMRVVLLSFVTYLTGLTEAIFSLDYSWIKTDITGQGIILLIGGLFLLWKSTSEIREKVEPEDHSDDENKPQNIKKAVMSAVILQIVMIDLVFSFDSVLTAVGMTNGVEGALTIMIIAVVISMVIMLVFAVPIGKFVNKHPSIQMLALAFLILIGFMLITEAAHLSNTVIFGAEIGAIPKGYLYFAIAFSLGVEALNMKVRKKK